MAEKNDLNLKENKLKYEMQQYERDEQRLMAEQQSLMQLIARSFPVEVQEEIKMDFERVKGLTQSQIMDDSELLYLQDSVAENSRY